MHIFYDILEVFILFPLEIDISTFKFKNISVFKKYDLKTLIVNTSPFHYPITQQKQFLVKISVYQFFEFELQIS